MTISELHKRLKDSGIPDDKYYLNGLYGSIDDSDKPALTIKAGKYTIEYETYFREKGEKCSIRTFKTEDAACDYLLKKIGDSWIIEQIQKIQGLGGMTVNERLYQSGLMYEFDKCKITNKTRAKQILRWLQVDEQSIELIVK